MLAAFDGRVAGLLDRVVFERLPVDGPDLLLLALDDALVEALSGLLAEPFALQHLQLEVREQEALALGVVGNGGIQVGTDVRPDVQANQVQHAETGAVRQPDEGSGERVGFLNGVVVLQGDLGDGAAKIAADAIGDEIRRVLAVNDAFAQPAIRVLANECDHFGVGFRTGDHFQQVHVPGGIEEMRAQEVAPELRREALHDLGQRNSAGAGGDNRRGLRNRFYAAPHSALDLEILGDGLDDPVAACNLVEIVVEIAGLDKRPGFVDEERAGLLFQRGFDSLCGGDAPVGSVLGSA